MAATADVQMKIAYCATRTRRVARGGVAFVILQTIGLPMVAIVPFLLPLLGLDKQKKARSRKGHNFI